jgi:hypothetical protein
MTEDAEVQDYPNSSTLFLMIYVFRVDMSQIDGGQFKV